MNGEDWKKYFSARVGRGNGWGGFCFEKSPEGVQLTSSIADQLTTKPIVVDDSWSSVVYDVGRGSGVWAVNYESDGPILEDYEVHRMEMKQVNNKRILRILSKECIFAYSKQRTHFVYFKQRVHFAYSKERFITRSVLLVCKRCNDS